jgi:hypothetical protein
MATPPSETAQARLAAAQEAERRTARAVEDRSRARLHDLLRLPPRARFKHLDDVDLTPADRGRLRRAIMPRLRLRPSRVLWVRGFWARRRRGVFRSVISTVLHPAFVMSMFLTGAWFGIARSQTPIVAYSNSYIPVRLFGSNGYSTDWTIQPRSWISVEKSFDEQALIRVWFLQAGYLHGVISSQGLYVRVSDK